MDSANRIGDLKWSLWQLPKMAQKQAGYTPRPKEDLAMRNQEAVCMFCQTVFEIHEKEAGYLALPLPF
jgi:hypothetical protein